jgi:tRNA threonylcarbamoyl adenosine modification protein YjeE
MPPTAPGGGSFTVALEDEEATRRLAVDIANMLEPGDVVALSGDLGAGKTAFTRAVIRHLASDETVAVPSPTFTLLQTYELPRLTLAHADLYRLSDASELEELGLDDVGDKAVVFVEWPDRVEGLLPPDRIEVALTLVPDRGPQAREATVTGLGASAARIERLALLRRFLADSGYAQAERHRMQGDASTRLYERLTRGDHRAILMNAPRRPDGPPVRDGKPYSALAHLAIEVTPFLAMANALRERGFSAPQIYQADLENGFVILEDLGSEPVVAGDPPRPIEERYAVATDVLVALHTQALPGELRVTPGRTYTLPPYDLGAFLIEVELLLDWYLPRAGIEVTQERRNEYVGLWRDALAPVLDHDKTWVLRDYHSPNLLWLAEREDIARIGLLDFQDALIGPPAYDLASLLQDARVDVEEALELRLLTRYVQARRERDPAFDATRLTGDYATLAAQRASKILGIFARLDRRDGKPQYLRHIPRIRGYLRRSLAHPTLAPLAAWYDANLPTEEEA